MVGWDESYYLEQGDGEEGAMVVVVRSGLALVEVLVNYCSCCDVHLMMYIPLSLQNCLQCNFHFPTKVLRITRLMLSVVV